MDQQSTKPKRKSQLGWRALRILLLSYLGVLLVLTLLENKMIYPAPRDTSTTDADPTTSSTGYEDVYFHSDDGTRLHGRLIARPGDRGVLMYCHGNGDMVEYLTPYALQLQKKLGATVFIFDYRGYGRSEGSPHEEGVMADGRAAREWLLNRCQIPSDEMILMGRSLGGGVAVGLAAESNPAGLVLQNTFNNLPAVASAHLPWFPVSWVMKNRYASDQKIGAVNCPILQSHGTADQVVPFELGQKLFETATEPKEFFVIEGRDHNQAEPPEYDSLLKSFVAANTHQD